MGYSHSMSAEIPFKSGVSIDAALAALKPLSDYCGWRLDDLLNNDLSGNDSIELTVEEDIVLYMSIYTCGEVSYSYPEHVCAFAEHLRNLAEAEAIELRNHDTGDLEGVISTFWYGDPDEVKAAQRIHAWQEAADLLRSVGTPEEVLSNTATLGGFAS